MLARQSSTSASTAAQTSSASSCTSGTRCAGTRRPGPEKPDETGDLPLHVLEQTTDAGERVHQLGKQSTDERLGRDGHLYLLLHVVEPAQLFGDPLGLLPARAIGAVREVDIDR